jgi:hypothetical protein
VTAVAIVPLTVRSPATTPVTASEKFTVTVETNPTFDPRSGTTARKTGGISSNVIVSLTVSEVFPHASFVLHVHRLGPIACRDGPTPRCGVALPLAPVHIVVAQVHLRNAADGVGGREVT